MPSSSPARARSESSELSPAPSLPPSEPRLDAIISRPNKKALLSLLLEQETVTTELQDEVTKLQDGGRELKGELEAKNKELETAKASIQELEAMVQELKASKKNIQASKKNLQASNKELQASNEELKTRTEELERALEVAATKGKDDESKQPLTEPLLATGTNGPSIQLDFNLGMEDEDPPMNVDPPSLLSSNHTSTLPTSPNLSENNDSPILAADASGSVLHAHSGTVQGLPQQRPSIVEYEKTVKDLRSIIQGLESRLSVVIQMKVQQNSQKQDIDNIWYNRRQDEILVSSLQSELKDARKEIERLGREQNEAVREATLKADTIWESVLEDADRDHRQIIQESQQTHQTAQEKLLRELEESVIHSQRLDQVLRQNVAFIAQLEEDLQQKESTIKQLREEGLARETQFETLTQEYFKLQSEFDKARVEYRDTLENLQLDNAKVTEEITMTLKTNLESIYEASYQQRSKRTEESMKKDFELRYGQLEEQVASLTTQHLDAKSELDTWKANSIDRQQAEKDTQDARVKVIEEARIRISRTRHEAAIAIKNSQEKWKVDKSSLLHRIPGLEATNAGLNEMIQRLSQEVDQLKSQKQGLQRLLEQGVEGLQALGRTQRSIPSGIQTTARSGIAALRQSRSSSSFSVAPRSSPVIAEDPPAPSNKRKAEDELYRGVPLKDRICWQDTSRGSGC